MTQSAQGASIASAPEVVGFRNQQRARWDALPVRQRAAISIVLELCSPSCSSSSTTRSATRSS